MKKKIFRPLAYMIPAFMLSMGVISCDNIFDVEPKDVLAKEQFYQTTADADAAIIGLYGKFMGLAKPYIVLNELRGDLVNLTGNAAANADLLALNYHTVQEGADNKYTDPSPFYEVILMANDVLANLKQMRGENRLTQAEYNQRYSDVGALRSWIYLQLGIHFNEIPYITEPLGNVEELKSVVNSVETKTVSLVSGSLLDSLISFTSSLPYLQNYNNILTEGIGSEKYFINKNLLLGDLYLWNSDYTMAATHYKRVMDNGSTSRYKISWLQDFLHETGFDDVNGRAASDEWIWTMPFDANYEPQNPFIDLFSVVGGSYLLKPSEESIEHWLEQSTAGDNAPDVRLEPAVALMNGQPVVEKYLYNFSPTNMYSKPGDWFLARAALLHLRFAEAANRDGHHKLAYALLNNGIQVNYDPNPGAGTQRDVTNIQQTKLPAPYNFDARRGDIPDIVGEYFANTGIRSRVGLPPVEVSNDSLRSIERAIIHEAALELAYEGHRWPDLLRIAMRRNQPEFLALAVAEKFEEVNDPRAQEVYTRLMDPANWFLPFRWE